MRRPRGMSSKHLHDSIAKVMRHFVSFRDAVVTPPIFFHTVSTVMLTTL